MSIESYSDDRHLIDCDALAASLDNITLLDLRPADECAWAASGRKLVRVGEAAAPVAPEKGPPTLPPFQAGRDMEIVARRFGVARAIDDEGTVIVDVRRRSEYEGTKKRARRVGTIPGAVNLFWRDHLDYHGALLPAEAAKGIIPDKTIITFCQGGYRSANTFLALNALGYPRVQNYVGSWGEWGNRDDSQIILPAS